MAGGHKQLGWSIELGHVVLLESPNPMVGSTGVRKKLGESF
jgi:hypothetical protein